MSKLFIKESTLTDLADAIRNKGIVPAEVSNSIGKCKTSNATSLDDPTPTDFFRSMEYYIISGVDSDTVRVDINCALSKKPAYENTGLISVGFYDEKGYHVGYPQTVLTGKALQQSVTITGITDSAFSIMITPFTGGSTTVSQGIMAAVTCEAFSMGTNTLSPTEMTEAINNIPIYNGEEEDA